MKNPLILSLIAGIFFGFWPVVARNTNLPSVWIAFLITLGTMLIVAIGSFPGMVTNSLPPAKLILIGLLGGAINGLGIIAYGRILANPAWNVSKYVPIVAVVSIAAAAIGALALFKEPITLQKSLGLLLAATAVYLLS